MESSVFRDGEQWKLSRYGCVTGTDVAKILGVDSSVSRRKLFESKLAHTDPIYNAGPYLKHLLEMGKIHEPVAREQFIGCMRHGNDDGSYSYIVPGMEVHRDYPWLTGTPDLFICDSNGDIHGIVEIKCHFHPEPYSAVPFQRKDELPLKHWLQIQTYMEIKNVENGYVWSWTLGNGATLFNIRRMDRFVFEQCIIPMLSQFHDFLKMYYDAGHPTVAPKSVLEYLTFRRGKKAIIHDVLESQFDDTVTFVKKYWPLK